MTGPIDPDIRRRYAPLSRPAGPLAKAADLEPVAKPPKAPRSSLGPNRARQAEMKPKQYAEQAKRCRNANCGCCSDSPEAAAKKGRRIIPHHWPTKANGGLDRDTMPLCDGPPHEGERACHQAFHDEAGSPEAFLRLRGCDVLAAIARMRRKPDHDCERFAVERVDVRRERSVYVCQRCQRELPDEQQTEGE